MEIKGQGLRGDGRRFRPRAATAAMLVERGSWVVTLADVNAGQGQQVEAALGALGALRANRRDERQARARLSRSRNRWAHCAAWSTAPASRRPRRWSARTARTGSTASRAIKHQPGRQLQHDPGSRPRS